MTGKPKYPEEDPKTRILGADECGPELEEVDDSKSHRFEPSGRENWWVPGLLEVEFTEAIHSGVQVNSDDFGERKKFPEAWPDAMRDTLQENGFLNWKPSFPLRYRWSPPQKEEAAREFYRKAGRDRFVTLRFVAQANVIKIADDLRKLPEIARAVPVPQLSAPAAPLDEPLVGTSDQVGNIVCRGTRCLENQWYIFRCGIDQAWDRAQASGIGVTIADIDWGFNPLHQDLTTRIAMKRSVLPNTNPTNVTNGGMLDHGTAVLGLAGARINDLGMAGIAFEANLWAIQAGTNGVIDPALWVEAIDFVLSQPGDDRRVIILEIQTRNCGNIEMVATINQAIINAIAAHIVVCVPAGNGNAARDAGIGDDGREIPLTGSILVGATKFDPVLNIRSNSNGGDRVVVYAPGDRMHDLTCSLPNDKYRNRFGGTSGAVAKVAGVVALMLEKNDQLTHADVREILAQSQIDVFDDPAAPRVGVLLDAEQAVCEALRRAGGECAPTEEVPPQ